MWQRYKKNKELNKDKCQKRNNKDVVVIEPLKRAFGSCFRLILPPILFLQELVTLSITAYY